MVGLSKSGEVFVGRKKEIDGFFEFLKKKDCPAFVVIGEPGIGKSSFLKEMADRLKGDERFVVGFYEVPFSGGIANPFVGALEELMDDLAVRGKEQVKSILKRVAEAGKKVALQKGDRFARAFVKDLVTKLVGKHVEEELEKLKEELDRTSTAFSLADEFVREHRSEFIYDFQEIFEELVKQFSDKEFVLLIDQFERTPMPSCDVLLDFARSRHENVHVAVALKVEEKGSERFQYVRPHLEQMSAKFVELSPLSIEEIGEWMRWLRKDFSYPELRKIKELSAGFPFAISEWLKPPIEGDLSKFEAVKGKYCEFVKWRVDGLKNGSKLMLFKLCVLRQPLSMEDYGKLAEIGTESCSLSSRELKDKWIFNKHGDTFWFRHELIRFCVEQDLIESERKKYHSNAAKFFEAQYDSAVNASRKAEFHVGLGCAYHFHCAGEYGKSLEHNSQLAEFCYDTGSLDIAEECCLREMEAAQRMKDERHEMAAKGNLATIYRIWGRIDDAYKTNQELLKHFRDKEDFPNQAVALHQLAIIEQDRKNYDKAIELCDQSLEIKRKLGNESGISKSLHELARIEQARGNYKKATELYNQSKDIDTKLGDQLGISRSLHNLAAIEQAIGNYDKAAELYNQSLKIFTELGDKRGIASSFAQLGLLSESKNQLNLARECFEIALQIFRQIGDKPHTSQARKDLQRILTKSKNNSSTSTTNA